MTSQGLGDLEQLVLLAVIRLRGDAYTVSVRSEIEARTPRVVSRGAVYVTLDRLARKGYLRSELGAPTPERGGKAKRMFFIEEQGLIALRSNLQGLSEMMKGMSRAIAVNWAP